MPLTAAVADHGQVSNQAAPAPADLAEVARQLRVILDAFPATTAGEQATVTHHGQVSDQLEPVPRLDSADVAEAARQLRAIVEALPPITARDRATARRIEGAAVALDVLAGNRQAAGR
jgi:hypothetical protein